QQHGGRLDGEVEQLRPSTAAEKSGNKINGKEIRTAPRPESHAGADFFARLFFCRIFRHALGLKPPMFLSPPSTRSDLIHRIPLGFLPPFYRGGGCSRRSNDRGAAGVTTPKQYTGDGEDESPPLPPHWLGAASREPPLEGQMTCPNALAIVLGYVALG